MNVARFAIGLAALTTAGLFQVPFAAIALAQDAPPQADRAGREGAGGQVGGGMDRGPQTRQQLAARIHQRFERMDTDHDGRITRAEFDAARPAPRPPADGVEPDRAGAGRGPGGPAMDFERIDADHDGIVTEAELGSRQMAMFDRADTDRDGIVTPAERAAQRAMRRGGEGGGPDGAMPPPAAPGG